MHYMNLYEVTLYFPIPVLLLLDVRYFSKLSFYAISMNTNKPNLRNWQKKPSFRPDFGPNLCHQV